MIEERRYVLRAGIVMVLFGVCLAGWALYAMSNSTWRQNGNMMPAIVLGLILLAIGGWGQRQVQRLPDRSRYFRVPSREFREHVLLWGFWITLVAGNLLASRLPGGISMTALLMLGLYTIWMGAAEVLNQYRSGRSTVTAPTGETTL